MDSVGKNPTPGGGTHKKFPKQVRGISELLVSPLANLDFSWISDSYAIFSAAKRLGFYIDERKKGGKYLMLMVVGRNENAQIFGQCSQILDT